MPRRNYPHHRSATSRRRPLPAVPSQICRQKRRFATERIARQHADTQNLLAPPLRLDVYHCAACGGWHLTRRTPAA
ncbi:MAG: hypothetical protein Q4B05_02200 [Candidatus Saccharibacteria bacterium]|nr:hypothetical protein [Candidatus Saccharibacteria bacterium]